MKVGAFNCETQSNNKNMMKVFLKKYKLDMYEVLRPTFNPKGYTRDVPQIGSMIKNITMIKDYWANWKDDFERHDWAFTRLIVGQVEMYKVDIVIDGVEGDGQIMYSHTYLTKFKNTPISLEPFEDVVEDVDMMLSKIYKRTRKWVMWTTKWKSRSKGMPIQYSPNIVLTSSSQSGALGTMLPLT